MSSRGGRRAIFCGAAIVGVIQGLNGGLVADGGWVVYFFFLRR